MLGLLVGGRSGDEDDEDAPAPRRLRARGLLVLVGACTATGLAVAVPLLLGPNRPAGQELASGSGWESVRLCRAEPSGACVERGRADAERLAGLLLPLRPVAEDLVTCLALGERYTVLLRGPQAPPELTVDTACGPVLADGGRYEVGEEARAAVAAAWADR